MSIDLTVPLGESCRGHGPQLGFVATVNVQVSDRIRVIVWILGAPGGGGRRGARRGAVEAGRSPMRRLTSEAGRSLAWSNEPR